MTDEPQPWTVRLTAAAEADFRRIVQWTRQHFGAAQARTYAGALRITLRELCTGPDQPGVRVRGEIADDVLSCHVARHGRRGSHLVLLRVADADARVLEVLRILHEAMDLPRHVAGLDEGG